MPYNEIANLISNVGFPIAAFILMWNLATKTIKENSEILRDLKNHIKGLKSIERR